MSYNLIIDGKKWESLYSFYSSCGILLKPLNEIKKTTLKNLTPQYNFHYEKFRRMNDNLVKKLKKNNVVTYGDLMEIDINDLKNNYSRNEILSIFSQSLPVIDGYLDDVYLRGIICEATLSYMRNYSIGHIVYDVIINHFKNFDDLRAKVDTNAMMFVYLAYYGFFGPRGYYLHENHIKIFQSLYSTLSSEDKNRLKPLLILTEAIKKKKIIYFDEFVNIFKITTKDLLEYQDYIQEGREKLKGNNDPNNVISNSIKNQLNESIELVISLHDNKIILDDDLKLIFGENSKEIDLFNHYKIMKKNLSNAK